MSDEELMRRIVADEFDNGGLLDKEALRARLETAIVELKHASDDIRYCNLIVAWKRLKYAREIVRPVQEFLDGYFDRHIDGETTE